ncbi:MAG: hypothetical protein ACOC4B_03345 [Bacteroidota bacterium]
MRHSLYLLIAIGLAVFFCACENNGNTVPDDSVLESFDSLAAENDSIYLGDSTIITAYYTGEKLTKECFNWSTNSNAPIIHIDGKPEQVYFFADPCVGPGSKNNVYCEISANNKKEKKLITIYILE